MSSASLGIIKYDERIVTMAYKELAENIRLEIRTREMIPEEGRKNHDLTAASGKIDKAVDYLNERIILSGIRLAKEVGEYVLNTFFDDDYAKFSDPSRSKSKSFRSLLMREDLMLGKATIYNFVRISHQLTLLPADVAAQLTLAHHRALLPLQDSENKRTLACQALQEGWASQVLSEEVRKLLPKSRRGRKPLSSLAKKIHRMEKMLDSALEEDFITQEIQELGPERSLVLIEQVDKNLERLEALKKALEGTLKI